MKNLRDRLDRPDDFADRAQQIFVKGLDVAGWQYEGSLSVMLALGPHDLPASRNFKDVVIVPMLLADDTPAYSDKVTASIRLGVTQLSTAQAVAKLNLVRDEHLKDYIFAFWNWNLSQLRFYRPEDVPKQIAEASKICERISKISDGEPRRQDFRVDCRAVAASLQ